MRFALLAITVAYTLVMLGLLAWLTRIDKPAVVRGRIPHMFAFIGGWEILIGATIIVDGDGLSAVGPIAMGVIFIAGSFTWVRLRRKFNL